MCLKNDLFSWKICNDYWYFFFSTFLPGCRRNVYKIFRRRLGHLLYVLWGFILLPVSRWYFGGDSWTSAKWNNWEKITALGTKAIYLSRSVSFPPFLSLDIFTWIFNEILMKSCWNCSWTLFSGSVYTKILFASNKLL